MGDRIEIRPLRRAPRREPARDIGVVLLGWALLAGMGAPLCLGCLAVGAPATFAAWFKPAPPPCKGSPCRLP